MILSLTMSYAHAATAEMSADEALTTGISLRTEGRYEEAIRTLAFAKTKAPSDLRIQSELATTYEWNQEPERSVEIWSAVVHERPWYVPARIRRARALASMDRLEEAESQIRTVLVEHPDNTEALKALAMVHRIRSEDQEAKSLLQRAIQLEPNDKEAELALQSVEESYHTELTASVGVSYFPAADGPSLLGAAGWKQKWLRSLSTLVGYEVGVPTGQDALTGTNLAHTAYAIASMKPAEELTLDAGYEIRIQDEIVHRAPLHAALRVAPPVTLLVGAKPGVSQTERVEVLADAGVQVAPLESLWVMAQGFYYLDSESHSSWSAVGTASFSTPDFWARLSAGGGEINELPTFTGGASIGIGLGTNIELRGAYELMLGGVERHAATLGTALRL